MYIRVEITSIVRFVLMHCLGGMQYAQVKHDMQNATYSILTHLAFHNDVTYL